jgi:hypothetical protein
MSEIILIDLINYQPYIQDNIKQLKLFNYNITIITDSSLISHFNSLTNINLITTENLEINNLEINNYNKKSKLDKTFRNGFWNLTSKRLFYLYLYMKKYNKNNCFHIENDVLIYDNINIPDKNKVWLTMDNPSRCIAGIMFIPNYTFLEPLINNYNYQKDDMTNLAIYYNNNLNLCNTFPIINSKKNNTIYSKNFKIFNTIFDAAAIGQYLGGTDPKKHIGITEGFINETCVINYSKYNFKWKYDKDKKIYLPYIIIDNKDILIANLHIHCKKLSNFSSQNPDKNMFYISVSSKN